MIMRWWNKGVREAWQSLLPSSSARGLCSLWAASPLGLLLLLPPDKRARAPCRQFLCSVCFTFVFCLFLCFPFLVPNLPLKSDTRAQARPYVVFISRIFPNWENSSSLSSWTSSTKAQRPLVVLGGRKPAGAAEKVSRGGFICHRTEYSRTQMLNPSFLLASCMDSEEISTVILSPTVGARKILRFFDTFWIMDGFLSTLRKENPLPSVLGETLQFPIQYPSAEKCVHVCCVGGWILKCRLVDFPVSEPFHIIQDRSPFSFQKIKCPDTFFGVCMMNWCFRAFV